MIFSVETARGELSVDKSLDYVFVAITKSETVYLSVNLSAPQARSLAHWLTTLANKIESKEPSNG